MGHERLGSLPKSLRWRAIVGNIAASADADFDVSGVAAQTLSNVQQRFGDVERDEMTKAAFAFLVNVAVASRDPDDPRPLQNLLLERTERVTPLKLAKALREHTAGSSTRTEYGAIAEHAATDALGLWYAAHKVQPSLFAPEDTHDVWRQAASGTGFCELSRLFFARYVERYLNYFLEREASAVLPNLDDRNRFKEAIQTHVEDVSQHAFDTSKIMQSYAAGWYSLNAATGTPSAQAISGFVSYAFKKMRDELLAEGLAG